MIERVQNSKDASLSESRSLPDGWVYKKINTLAQLRKEIYKPDEKLSLPYIGLEHIEQQKLNLVSIGSSQEIVSNKFKFYNGDILYGKLRPYFRKVYYPEFNGVCSTDIWVLKNKETIYSKFLYYLIATEEFTSVANSGSSGTRMPRADWEQVKNAEFPIPTNEGEQKAIANILSSLDDKIELNRKMNETLEKIAQAIFKRWFIDFEFPNDEGKPYKSSGGAMVDSELGEIPKGWEVETLDEIADFLNGLAMQKYPPESKEYLPVIKIRELRNGITDSTDKASANLDKNYIVQDGDVLFSWSGSLLLKIWIGGKGALNQHLFKVTSTTFPKWFYYYWANQHLEKFRNIASDKATTMGHIQRHHLTESLVVIPNQIILNKGDDIISNIFELHIKNALEVNGLIQLRDLLLPRLMSGKIRVPV